MPRSVYIIEIRPHWHSLVAPSLAQGKSCFYVGETAKDPEERLEEHLTGVSNGKLKSPSAAVFKRMRASQDGKALRRGQDVWLRSRLAHHLAGEPVQTHTESVEREQQVIMKLRDQGHRVYGA